MASGDDGGVERLPNVAPCFVKVETEIPSD